MNLEELLDKVRGVYPNSDLSIIENIYRFSRKAHTGQIRVSGEPYVNHPLEVASILCDMGLDINTIAAGILHDVIEDTGYTLEDLEDEFGSEIAMLVDGVTKLGKFQYKTKEERQVENLRKMFLAMAKDIRVIMIKLADRLHNMRTLKCMRLDKQKEKAEETLEIYAPLAHRLGIYKVKGELEDLALRYIDKEKYYDLVEKVAKKRQEREDYIIEVMETLKIKLKEMDIKAEIKGRPKHFYSIYRKMEFQNKSFEQIYDITAVRVVVDSIKDCYGVLGIAHTMWKPIPGRFKDFIAMPKPNMYQSLHTTVIGPQGDPLEIQIRTWEMHRTAEYGIAAHWKYKENKLKSDEMDLKLAWLRQLLEWQDEAKDPGEFMENLKIDLFTDQVFVFTPKGDVIDLPKDSTPIDFAYTIHTAVGNKCVGAKVNGRIVTLDYTLKTGDIVEILTSASSNGPSWDWIKIIKSSQAKSKIKAWFKKETKEENISLGKELLEKEAKKEGYTLSQLIDSKWCNDILKKYSLNSMDDLYAAVGYGGLTLKQVMTKLVRELKKYEVPTKIDEENELEKISLYTGKKNTNYSGIKVKGAENIMVRFARCCNPLEGDEIIGYITRGRGVSVHRKDCTNIKSDTMETDRLIDVSWEIGSKIAHDAKIQIIALDRQGLLTEVTTLISDSNLKVSAINARTTKDRTTKINIVLQIKDTEQLDKIINKFKKLKNVSNVFRVKA